MPRVDRKAKVEATSAWTGYFENRTVDGTGNQIIDISDEGVVCCNVQKKTTYGFLTLTLTGNKPVTTTAEYGIVDDCVK